LPALCKNHFCANQTIKGVETTNCTKESQERCTRQSALIVAKNAKYHSNPTKADPSTAENVGQKEDPQEEADIKPLQANI